MGVRKGVRETKRCEACCSQEAERGWAEIKTRSSRSAKSEANTQSRVTQSPPYLIFHTPTQRSKSYAGVSSLFPSTPSLRFPASPLLTTLSNLVTQSPPLFPTQLTSYGHSVLKALRWRLVAIPLNSLVTTLSSLAPSSLHYPASRVTQSPPPLYSPPPISLLLRPLSPQSLLRWRLLVFLRL